MRVWVDIEDVLAYAAGGARPRGIPRLAFELCQALADELVEDGGVGFLRHDPRGGFAPVRLTALAEAFAGPAAPEPDREHAPNRTLPCLVPLSPAGSSQIWPQRRSLGRRAVRALLLRIPPRPRDAMLRLARLQIEALRAFADFLLALLPPPQPGQDGPVLALPAPASPEPLQRQPPPRPRFPAGVRPGDMLLSVGASWTDPQYAMRVAGVCAAHGLRFALVAYDLIPVLRPEWVSPGNPEQFATWLRGLLPQADFVFAISRHTAHDLRRYAAGQAIPLPGIVQRLPLGTGLAALPGNETPSAALPPPGSYVLCVGSLEVRKNHALLFRVWRRLMEELPPGRLPVLVFAGGISWLVGDLLEQLDNCDWLDGRIRLVRDPSDADLAALYRGCLFTLYPSLYEGWGLPVSESLAFGKPCIAAGTTSLPEAGGALARYFDPEDVGDAARVIGEALRDRAGLAAWQDRVAREFRDVPWRETARAIAAAAQEDMPETREELAA